MARYRGEAPPDDGYQGEYVVDMAERMRAELGDAVTEEQAREWGYHDAVRALRDDLDRIGVHFDTWFSERTLHEAGDVVRVLDDLRAPRRRRSTTTAPPGCARPTSAISATACS